MTGIVHCGRCNGSIDTAKDTFFSVPSGDPSGWKLLCATCEPVWKYNRQHPRSVVECPACKHRFEAP